MDRLTDEELLVYSRVQRVLAEDARRRAAARFEGGDPDDDELAAGRKIVETRAA